LTLPHPRLKKVPKPVVKVTLVLIITQKKKPEKKKALYHASVGKKQGFREKYYFIKSIIGNIFF